MPTEILKEKEQNIEKLREDLNLNKIPKLGVEVEKLYNKINKINEVFNVIKNIPEEWDLQRFEINQNLNKWKFKIIKEEKENNNFKSILNSIVLSAFGNSLLAFAGPIGLGISVLSVLCTSFFHFSAKNEKETLENIFIKILSNLEKKLQLGIVEINERIESIYNEVKLLEECYYQISTYDKNYINLTYVQKIELGKYVNIMKGTKKLITFPIMALMQNFDDNDYIYYNGNANDVKKKNLFVLLANMLENIYLNEEERKLLVKVMKNNDNFFKNNNIRKEDMTLELLNDVFNVLSKK